MDILPSVSQSDDVSSIRPSATTEVEHQNTSSSDLEMKGVDSSEPIESETCLMKTETEETDRQDLDAPETDEVDDDGFTLVMGSKRRRSDACKKSREGKKARKKQRNLVERNMGTKQDYYDVFGQNVVASLTLKDDPLLMHPKSQIKVRDLHSLILWCLAEAVNPHWIFVKHRPLVEHAVVIIVDGLSQALVKRHKEQLKFLYTMSLNHTPLSLQVPCSLYLSTCVLQHFLNCTIDRVKGAIKPLVRVGSQIIFATPKHHHQNDRKQSDSSNSNTSQRKQQKDESKQENLSDKPGPLVYLATETDLRLHGFPIPYEPEFENFVRTSLEIEEKLTEYKSVSDPANTPLDSAKSASARVFSNISSMIHIPGEPSIDAGDFSLLRALDCEMVLTASGYSLARMSILDGEGKELVDALVEQTEPVIDYLTKYSGITEELLKDNATITFSEAQSLFLKHVSARHILVGHSLENDLKALRIIHMRIMDTSLLYPHPRQSTYKSSLKYLANKFLNVSIRQNGTEAGHDSVEDALAALELARMKLKQGPEFGVIVTAGDALFDILGRLEKSTCLVGPIGVCRRYAGDRTNAIGTGSDEDTTRRVIKELHRIRKQNGNDSDDKNNDDAEDNSDSEVKDSNKSLQNEEDSESSESDEDDEGSNDNGALLMGDSKMPGAPADLLVAHMPELFNFLDDYHPATMRHNRDSQGGATGNAPSNVDSSAGSSESGTLSLPLEPLTDLNFNLPESKDSKSILSDINRRISAIWEACPKNTLVMVMSGQSSVVAAKHITHVVTQLKRHQVVSSATSAENSDYQEISNKINEGDALLKTMMNANQEGVVFMNIKS